MLSVDRGRGTGEEELRFLGLPREGEGGRGGKFFLS